MKHLFLVCSLVANLVPAGAFAAENQPATTVPAEQFTLNEQLLIPDADGTFNARGYVSRLEFTLAVVNKFYANEDFDNCYRNIAPSADMSFEHLFSDVEISSWYGTRLCAAMHAGLIQGKSDGSFAPFETITVAEASKILAKTYGLPHVPTGNDAWFSAAMQSLARRGAIAGTVSPDAPLSRASMAEMVYALRDEEEDSVLTPVTEETVTEFVPQPLPGSDADLNSKGIVTDTTTQPTEQTPTVAAGIADNCAPIMGSGSPGHAALVLGYSVKPSITKVSRRLLREQVEAAYQDQGFANKADQRTVVATKVPCKGIYANSPGAALASMEQKSIRPTNVVRTPTRYRDMLSQKKGQ